MVTSLGLPSRWVLCVPAPECFRVLVGGLGAVDLAVRPPALELGPWLAAAFTASRLLGQEMGLGRACGHWEAVGRKSVLPCAIRDNVDNVHLADMQKEHLQDAKEHSGERWVNSAVTCTTTCVFLCCLCAAVQGEKGRNTSAMMKSCRFNFKIKSAEKAWMLQAKAWEHASEMPLAHDLQMQFCTPLVAGMGTCLSWREEHCHLMLGRTCFPSLGASHDAKPALLPATWVQSSAQTSGFKLSPLLSFRMRWSPHSSARIWWRRGAPIHPYGDGSRSISGKIFYATGLLIYPFSLEARRSSWHSVLGQHHNALMSCSECCK